jgi:Fe-S oxidoreductase
MDAERTVLERLGLDFEVLDSGCCGMAGSFGFEAAKYDVSVACAERVLLPAVRKLDAQALLLTNGFSCRAQIEELGGRRPLHLAEVLNMGL